MGEARRRGTLEERCRAAVRRNKANLVRLIGGEGLEPNADLRAGIAPFLNLMSAEKWQRRRAEIISSINTAKRETELGKSKSIRVREDEIGWYIFLCEQALDDPLCLDVSQLARAAPFFSAIGAKWEYGNRVRGLDKKIREILHKYKKNPDGLIFEVLVALSYAAKGWDVEMLEERPPSKSPDMLVSKDGVEIYVECKRLERRTSYAERERDDFLKLWDAGKDVLLENRQWVWFKALPSTQLIQHSRLE